MMPGRMSTLHQPGFSTEAAPSRAAWVRAGRGPIADRVRSLDVFRGITMAAMILVNNKGDWSHAYAPLEHSTWNGCTPTDLIFPFFVFIVGVAIPFSLAGRRRKLGEAGLDLAEQNRAIVLNTIRRTAILFGLGLLLYATPIRLPGHGGTGLGIFEPSTLRIPGVLQRIALCYCAAALLTAFCTWRTRTAVAASLLILYALLMWFVPVPGYGAGKLTADGSLASYLDRFLLGHHTYKPNYDPEGLLSTLPAIGTALIGTLAGEWLRRPRTAPEKVAGLFAAGVVLAILGYVTDGLLLPINKALWTPSFVLYTGGLALLGFGLCYFLIDVHGHERWARPFTILGMNAIAVYFLSSMIGRFTLLIPMGYTAGSEPISLKTWLYDHLFGSLTTSRIHLSPYIASTAWGVGYVLVFLALATWMYRRRWFVKV
jgi:predicted acyltransferase